MITIVAFLSLSSIITPRLAEAYGKDFLAFETILGKPDDVYKDGREDRIWRRRDGSIVDVAKDKGATKVTAVLISFPRGRPQTWESRLKQIGVGVDNAKSSRVRQIAIIKGCANIPSGWTVWWEPGTRSAKDTGHRQDEVILGIAHPRIY